MDWPYHHSEGSIGWLSRGMTQARLRWLVQFADLTGVWGVTFWVTLFNVLIIWALGARISTGSGSDQVLIRRQALTIALMLAVPLLYTGYVFQMQPSDQKLLSVLLVQPNTNPWRETERGTDAQALKRTAALTSRALRQAPESVDLVVWPESAVPFVLPREEEVRNFLTRQVARWQTPLLTGAMDAKTYANPNERSPLLKFQCSDTEFSTPRFCSRHGF
jgi:apolipoprotein N-acyltransferase